MSTHATATPVDEKIVYLPLDKLVESPFNPRKTFNEQGLDELATDIASIGRILQPLLVRPIVPQLFSAQFAEGDESVITGWEIVFGHRRYRAGRMAELKTAPCMVRAMTDAEVQRAQISENLQREDVHPIEEAEGFQALMRDHGLTADDIAVQTGKSRSFVYSRLKLLNACPEVRTACVKGEFGSEVTLLIARVGGDKLQKKALGYIAGKYLKPGDGGEQSFRRIQDLLNERFMLDIKDAIFDAEDATLSSAGRCSSCPKRSGNAPEFEDVARGDKRESWSRKHSGSNVCTDPDCFAQKKTLHLVRQANALELKGKTVIGGNRARALIGADGKVKGGYIPLKLVPAEVKGMAASTLMGRPLGAIVIQDPRSGKTVEAAKLVDVQEFAKRVGVKAPQPEEGGGSRGPTIADRMRAEANARREAEKLSAENTARFEMLTRVRAATLAAPRRTWDMRLIARACVGRVDHWDQRVLARLYGVEDLDKIRERLDTMTADELGQLMLDCALVKGVHCGHAGWIKDKPKTLAAAAVEYGVATESAATPSTAGASANKGKARAGKASKSTPAPASKKNPGPSVAIAGAPDDAGLFDEQEQPEASGSVSSQTTPAVAGDRAPPSPAAAWPFPDHGRAVGVVQ